MNRMLEHLVSTALLLLALWVGFTTFRYGIMSSWFAVMLSGVFTLAFAFIQYQYLRGLNEE